MPHHPAAVKLSTGEPGSNYLHTDLIGDLVQSFDHPTIVECNTAMHYQVAVDQACIDLVYAAEGGDSLVQRMSHAMACIRWSMQRQSGWAAGSTSLSALMRNNRRRT